MKTCLASGCRANPDGSENPASSPLPSFEPRVPEPVEEGVPAPHELGQGRLEVVDRAGRVGTVPLHRPIGPHPVAGPDLGLTIARSHEQVEVPVVVPRGEHADGIGLVEPREPVEVRVLAEHMVDVVVAHGLDGGGNHGDRSGADPVGERSPMGGECVGHDRRV